MPDREKVIKGLECCIKNDHKTCSYKSEDKGITATPCTTFLMRDALALINEQEPRLMTLAEVKAQKPDEDTDDNWVWIEYAGGCCRLIHIVKFHSLVCAEFPKGHSELHYMHTSTYCGDPRIRQLFMSHANFDTYGRTWRCWNARPTEQQREATPWKK